MKKVNNRIKMTICSYDEEIDKELLGFVKGAKYSMGVMYSLMG